MFKGDQFAQVREIIQVAVIVGAFVWGIYVFAYEQRFKPASEPPSMVITGSLRRLAEHNGLLQIGFKGVFHNTGHSEVSIIALGFTALGIRYVTNKTPAVRTQGGTTLYQRDTRTLSRTRVYELTQLTGIADKSIKATLSEAPGEDFPIQNIFLVKKGEFDAIVLYGTVAYAKDASAGAYPTKITRSNNDAVAFLSRNNDAGFYPLQLKLDEITLW